jgi:hypothetical protein
MSHPAQSSGRPGGKLGGYVSGGATNTNVTDVAVTGIKRMQGANLPK